MIGLRRLSSLCEDSGDVHRFFLIPLKLLQDARYRTGASRAFRLCSTCLLLISPPILWTSVVCERTLNLYVKPRNFALPQVTLKCRALNPIVLTGG